MPLTGSNAGALSDALLDCCTKFGLAPEDISRKLVALQADGAAVMQGVVGGLGAVFRREHAPHMVTFNCSSHRVDLASEELENNPVFQQIKMTLSLLASFYNRSTKAVNELRDAQGAMGTAGVKVKKIYEVRWNSIYESLVAVLREYPAILHNLTAVDPAGPLLAAVSRAEMLLGSYALMPALESLQALLKVLQRRGLFLGDVPPAIDSIISHLARMYIAPQTKFRTSEFLGRNGSGIGSGGDATAAGEAGSGCGSGGDAAAASEAGSSGARSSKSRTITICSWHDLATAADGAPLCFVDLPERPERLLRGAVVDERPQPPELHYRHEVDGQPALLVPTTAVPPSDGQPGRPHCRARGVDVELLGAVNSRPAQ